MWKFKPTFCLFLYIAIHTNHVFAEDLLYLYQQALQFDPNLKSAQLQVEMSEAQRSQAGGMLLPQVNANINISGNNQNITTNIPNSASLSNASLYSGERYNVALTQTVFDLPKFMNWKRYQKLVAQTKLSSDEALQSLIYNLIERYFKVLETSDALLLVQQEMTLTQKQLRQLKRQFEKQLVQITDVYEMEAKLDLLAADQIAAETQFDIAQEALVELTGTRIKQLMTLRNDIAFKELTGAIDQWLAQAENLNPGLAAQNKAIEAANDQVWQQRAKHLPTVDMQLNYYNTNTGQPGYQNQTNLVDTEMAAVNINVPLFSGGSTTAAASEAAKNLEINKEKRIALLRALIKDTRDSFLSTNASVKRISAAEKALYSSNKAREAMEKGFNLGMQTISDVLISQGREYKAKQEILQAKYDYIKNRARFERVTGLITEQYLITVNQWLEINKS